MQIKSYFSDLLSFWYYEYKFLFSNRDWKSDGWNIICAIMLPNKSIGQTTNPATMAGKTEVLILVWPTFAEKKNVCFIFE